MRSFARLTIAACLFLAAAVRAQGPAAAPPDDFFRPPGLQQATLSPHGRQLAFMAAVGGNRVGLFVVDLARPDRLRRAALFRNADVRRYEWVNEGRLVFDITDARVGIGEQRFSEGLFSVRPDGNGMRKLVQTDQPAVSETRHVGREPLPYNHMLLRAIGTDGEDIIIGRLESDGHRGWKAVVPIRLDADTGRTTAIAGGAPELVQSWLFDAQGEPRVAIAAQQGRETVWWRGPGEAQWQKLEERDDRLQRWSPRFIDPQGRLYVVHSDGKGFGVLSRFDVQQRQFQGQPIVSTPGFDFAGSLVIDRSTGRLLGVRVRTDAEATAWFDERMKAVQSLADARHPGRVNRLSCRRCGEDDAVVLVFSYSDQDPGRYEVYYTKESRWLGVGAVMPSIDPRRMATQDFHRIKARDGRDLPLWLTLPQGSRPGERRPAVVMVHGGPFVRGSHWEWEPMEQFLASRGYIVISPEFRGSRGFGVEHFRAGWKQWGRGMQDDVADALQWAIDEGHVDADRVCIAGASYGGYATLMGLVRHPELYRCGVAWAAVTDPLLMFKWNWSSDLGDDWREYGLPRMLGDPVADVEMLRAVSPVLQAARIKAPVLLAFGGADVRVPIEHGHLMRDALRKAGNDPTWIVYPSEGHGWRTFENQVDFARRVEAFLAEHLGAKR